MPTKGADREYLPPMDARHSTSTDDRAACPTRPSMRSGRWRPSGSPKHLPHWAGGSDQQFAAAARIRVVIRKRNSLYPKTFRSSRSLRDLSLTHTPMSGGLGVTWTGRSKL
jgi:hypothetical protein